MVLQRKSGKTKNLYNFNIESAGEGGRDQKGVVAKKLDGLGIIEELSRVKKKKKDDREISYWRERPGKGV